MSAVAIDYVAPLAVDETEGRGLVVRVVDAQGNQVDPRQVHHECWRSAGDPYTGNGYILYRRPETPWLEFCYCIMVAEAMGPGMSGR